MIKEFFLGPSPKKNKIRKKKSGWSKFRLKRKISKKMVIIFFVFFFWSLWVWKLYTLWFHDSDQVIESVFITEESKIRYDSADITTSIQDYLVGKNYRLFTANWQADFDAFIKTEFPIIEKLQMAQTENSHHVAINIIYHQPLISFHNKNRSWVSWENKVYSVQSWDQLLEETIRLSLPAYTNDFTDLAWIFHHIYDTTLYDICSNILDILDGNLLSDILYEPWWQKLHISYDWKLLLFHLDKLLDPQLAKLLDISQYYPDYWSINQIDLWSSENIIVK